MRLLQRNYQDYNMYGILPYKLQESYSPENITILNLRVIKYSITSGQLNSFIEIYSHFKIFWCYEAYWRLATCEILYEDLSAAW